MKRRTFDKIMTAMGLGLTIFLFATAALLNWGASFASQSVTDQLTPQKIMFPAPDSEGLNALPAADKAAVEKYAGQQVTTGEQARVYATNYIGVHVKGVAGGKTYSEVSGAALGKSAEAKANPGNAALAAEAAALMGQRTTLFMGETLKGLLMNAYAFGTLATIAKTAAAVALIGGLVFLLLTLAGYMHLRRTDADATIQSPLSVRKNGPGKIPGRFFI